MVLIPVQDIVRLRALEKAGHITLHRHTGKKVGGLYGGTVRAWYVHDGKYEFVWNNRVFRTEYLSGCFYPFVFLVHAKYFICDKETGQVVTASDEPTTNPKYYSDPC